MIKPLNSETVYPWDERLVSSSFIKEVLKAIYN
jgi:hypothetical protein